MKAKLLKSTLLIFLFFAFEKNYAQTLVVPPAPGNLSSVEHLFQSDDYTVEVRKSGDVDYIPCFVYKSDNYWTGQYTDSKGQLQTAVPKTSKSASFTNVSFLDTSIDVRVTFKNTISSATIRPLNFGVTPQFSGKVLTFTLNEPRKISIEINDRLNPLFLFADTPDVPNTSATYYYAPGTVTNIGLKQIKLSSNQSVYIAAGAVVEGSFDFNFAVTGIRIGGRGILSMGEWIHNSNALAYLGDHSAFESNSTNNMIIEGITIANSCGWQMPFYNSDGNKTYNNQIRNVKTVSWSGNTDGIWVNGTGHVIDDCFIFNNDDALMSHSASNCKISNIVFWGGPWGRLYWHNNQLSLSENMTFENINVIGKDAGTDLILIDGTSTLASQLNNFTFRNLRVESHTGFSNKFLKFTSGSKSINNWKFENVTIDDVKTDEGDISNTAASPINGVSFVNLKMGSTYATNLTQAKMSTSAFATNVTFGLAPEIHVKQSTTDIVDNTGSFPFRNVTINTSKTLTFTIQNQGGAALNLTGSTKVVVTGSAFSLVTDAPATINADGSATFQVQFQPTALSSYSGTVSIANSDTDENIYNFAITGKALSNAVTWTGALSTAYEASGNWFTNLVPSATNTITIPGGLTNYPVINTNQTIGGGTIASGASLTVAEGKVLTITGTLNNTGDLILKSSTSGTASLLSDTSVDNITQQRYLTSAQRGWRLLSNPVSTKTFNALATSSNITLSTDYTGAYIPATNTWTSTDGTVNMTTQQAYKVFITGKVGEAPAYATGPTNVTLVNKGTAANTVPASIATTSGRYYLVANPYTAPVSVSRIIATSTGLSNTVSYYNPNNAAANVKLKAGGYNFSTVSGVAGSATDVVIPPMGAIFVQATSAGTINVPKTAIYTGTVTAPAGNYNHKTVQAIEASTNALKVEIISEGTYYDTVALQFKAIGEAGSNVDFGKLPNSILDAYTLLGSNKMAVSELELAAQTIPLGITSTIQKSYTFKVVDNTIPAGFEAVLVDNVLNTNTVLVPGTTYDFAIDSTPASQGDARFAINLRTAGSSLGVNAKELEAKIQVYPNPSRGEFNITNTLENAATIEISSLNGQVIHSQKLNEGITTIQTKSWATGVYILKASSNGKETTKKLIVQ